MTILAESLAGVAIVVTGAVVWLWRDRRKRKDEAPASIVLLLEHPKTIDVQLLARLFSAAAGRGIQSIALEDQGDDKDNQEPVGDMVAGASPHFIAQVDGTTFNIHNWASPYMSDPVEASEHFPELRLRKAIKDHTAWLSVDIIRPEAATPRAYQMLARVVASLVDTECLALYHPPLNQFVPCKPDEVVLKLKAEDPIKEVFREMAGVPVIPIDDDPRLKGAEVEARRRFSEFETALRQKEGSRFAIKTVITRNGNSEHIWVEVGRISPGKLEGRLGNDPVDLGELKIGAKMEVERDQVEDWTYLWKGNSFGMFTVPVIKKIEGDRQRQE